MSELAKILLVDDNPKYLRDALPFYGYNVETAADGVQALKLLNKKHYDMVLLDVMMPNMNGWETLNAIRASKKTELIPVIMISAVNEEQKIITGLKTGADDYIVKPFILPNLLARMEAVLRRTNRQKTVEKNLDLPYNIDKKPLLTSREKEVLALAAKGESNKDIAEKLVLREVTIKSHLNNIFKKLNVTNRTQAVLLAMQTDLIDN